MRFLHQKRLISSLLYYYHAQPDQLSLDHHHSFSVVSPLPFRPTNNYYLLDKCQQTNRHTRGAHNRCIIRFTGGWAYNWKGGRDYKRQFTVCDWPGFEIWNHGKWIEFGLPILLKRKTGNGQSSPWNMWISPKIFLDQLNTWIHVKLVSGEVRKLLLSVVTKNWTVANTILCTFCFEAVARGLDDVSNNRLTLNLRMSQELDSFIYNF